VKTTDKKAVKTTDEK